MKQNIWALFFSKKNSFNIGKHKRDNGQWNMVRFKYYKHCRLMDIPEFLRKIVIWNPENRDAGRHHFVSL